MGPGPSNEGPGAQKALCGGPFVLEEGGVGRPHGTRVLGQQLAHSHSISVHTVHTGFNALWFPSGILNNSSLNLCSLSEGH